MEEGPEHGQSNHQENVAHTGGEEGFLGGVCSAGAFVVETNEEVRAQPHQFPEDEEPEERVSQDHAEHSRTEQHEFSVEAMVAVVVDGVGVHVADGESVDEQTEERGDEQQHHGHVVDVNPKTKRYFCHRRLS